MAGLIVKRGDIDRAIQMLDEALKLQKNIEDVEGQAYSLSEMAKILIKFDEETALNYWEQAISIQNRIGDIYGKALTLMGMGECFEEKKNIDKAIEKLKQSQTIFEKCGDNKYNCNVLFKIAKNLQKNQEIDEAINFFEKAYIAEQKSGNIERQADLLNEIAVTIYQRDLNLAYNKWEEALELYKKCKGLEVQVAATLNNMATVLAKQGLFKFALIKCEQALEIQESLNSWNETKKIVENFVGMALDLDDNESKRYYLLRASRTYAKNDSWQELLKTLIVIGDIDNEACYFAQALWLALHIPISEQFAIFNIISLVEIVGMESEMAPLLASTGLLFIGTDKKDTSMNEKIAKNVSVILEGCAKARNIEDGEFEKWIIENNLYKPQENMLLIKELLIKLVGKNNWFFDYEAFIIQNERHCSLN